MKTTNLKTAAITALFGIGLLAGCTNSTTNQKTSDMEIFNRCENSNDILIAIENWKTVHPLLKILPVDWNYTIPFGILHAPEPSKTVQRFLQAIPAVMEL